jgi:hypothetical protein
MPDTESISDEDIADWPATPPRPIPVLETRSIHYINTSPQPGPSHTIQPYTPSPPRLRMPTQVVCAARGRNRARSRSVERHHGSKRVATPSPQRRVAERPDPIPEEEDDEVLIIGVTPAERTGFLGPIRTKPAPKRRR